MKIPESEPMEIPVICQSYKLPKLKENNQMVLGKLYQLSILLLIHVAPYFAITINYFHHLEYFTMLSICTESRESISCYESDLFLTLIFLIASITGWLFCASQNCLKPEKSCNLQKKVFI